MSAEKVLWGRLFRAFHARKDTELFIKGDCHEKITCFFALLDDDTITGFV